MYSLLVAVGQDGVPLERAVGRSFEITRQLMPTMHSKVRGFRGDLPEVSGSWFYYLPDPPPAAPQIAVHSDKRQWVISFGILDESDTTTAETVGREYRRGGIDAARHLSGSFSAIVVDRVDGSVFTIGDVIGRRALRYMQADGTLLISNHDLPIVGTGLCPVDFDLTSAASILSCEWSLQGRPLLKALRSCRPDGYLRWHCGVSEWVDTDTLLLADRVDVEDTRGRRAVVQQMVDGVLRGVQKHCGSEPTVRADLTAGLDSRAALAALIHAVPVERIVTATAGEEGHLDVRVAVEVAKRCGVVHRRLPAVEPSVDAFFDNCDVFAYFMNGATNSKRALGSPLRYNPTINRAIGGAAGEIFRGQYYGKELPATSDLDHASALGLIRKAVRSTESTLWSDPAIPAAVDDRLQRVVGGIADRTASGCDVLDLYYLRERFANWALGARMPQEERRYRPLESTAAIRAAFRLPPPIGSFNNLHRELIRTVLPQVYWLPVNDRYVLPIQGIGRSLPGLHGLALRTLTRRPANRPNRGIESLQTTMLAAPLKGAARDLLESSDSFGVRLFGELNMRDIVESHLAGTHNRTRVLGFLITLERWKSLVRRASQLARNAIAAGQ